MPPVARSSGMELDSWLDGHEFESWQGLLILEVGKIDSLASLHPGMNLYRVKPTDWHPAQGELKYSQLLHVTETGDKYPHDEPYNGSVEGFLLSFIHISFVQVYLSLTLHDKLSNIV
jgi:hypothetical protein